MRTLPLLTEANIGVLAMAEQDNAPAIISREAARQAGLRRFFTNVPCIHGHVAERYVSTGQCAECQRLHRRKQYWKNPQVEIDKQKAYYVANREQVRARANAYYEAHPEKMKAHAKAWYHKNREARAKLKAEERRANPELIRQRWRRWAEANPEQVAANWRLKRARKSGAEGQHTATELKALLVRQKSKCASCATSLKPGYHADHIVPLSKGGSDWITNIQLLCPSCNCRKWAKDPFIWAQELGRLL